MNIKILVPTDMSENSRGALLFAMEIARKFNGQLVVLYVTEIAKPQQWVSPEEEEHRKHRELEITRRLEYFVSGTFSGAEILFFDYSCILHYNFGFVHTVLDYAVKNDFSHICLATSGDRVVDRWMGTKATALVEESSIPVFCVPDWYKPKSIDVIIYATDMAYLEDELLKVKSLSDKLSAKVYVVHLSGDSNESKVAHGPNELLYFITLPRNKKMSFSDQLEELVSRYKASLLIIISDKRKGFFESVFMQSRARKLSLNPQIPLLIYHRNIK